MIQEYLEFLQSSLGDICNQPADRELRTAAYHSQINPPEILTEKNAECLPLAPNTVSNLKTAF